VAFVFLMFWGSVGLWINGLVTLAETVQGGELDALVSLLREKVYTFGCFQPLADCFVTRNAGIATAHGVGGGGVGAEELLSHTACKRSTRIQTPKPLPCPA
jgi:phosphotransferase system  glucose/maltose/N-acetylglucosamine-specific IIC component